MSPSTERFFWKQLKLLKHIPILPSDWIALHPADRQDVLLYWFKRNQLAYLRLYKKGLHKLFRKELRNESSRPKTRRVRKG